MGIVIGDIISHYKILEKIGEGGMGVVYKAEDTKLKRLVALKFLPPEMSLYADAKQRFIREAQAAASLDHPNIGTIFEINEAQDKIYIAMAFVEGKTLKEKLSSGPLDIQTAIDIVSQIAAGLKHAHARGLVHRDIKPGNIMLTEEGQAKILDFGLAKLSWGVDLTRTMAVMGTPAYMSPEQAKGEAVDQRTDIWSLGCVFFEMLAAQPPFSGKHEQARLYSILNEPPQRISDLRKDLPHQLGMIIQRCLEKNPRDRYQQVAELAEALNSLEPTAQEEPKSSIAVLPFLNMSADPENEYFSDGLAEELINALTKVRDLRVVARTSSFAFKGEKIDIREVGTKLNVKTLLEGSVRKAGARLRITVQLINVADGYHLWSERFDREMEDIFAIQDEITEKIVEKLRTELLPAGGSVRTRRPPNIESYDQYLRGRYYMSKFLIDKAIERYEQAVALDPDCAPAHASLAEAYVLLSTGFDVLPSQEAMPKAREAAQKALEIDPTLAEAHVSLGMVAMCYEWDRRAAREHFRKAIALNPNSAAAYQWLEMLWTFLEGDLDQAQAAIERAQELDPMNLLIKVRVGYIYIYRRDYGRAVQFFQNLLELEPNFPMAYVGLMESYGRWGKLNESLAAGEKSIELQGPSRVSGAQLGALGYWAARAGKKTRARQLLDELEARSKKGYASQMWMAVLLHGLGERDRAFQFFEKCFEERDGSMFYIIAFPSFDSDDPRFASLLKKMNLENLLEKKPWRREYSRKNWKGETHV
jgi:serine/threonine protein kinase/Tfp pilus assembly protein PilF